MVKVRFGGIDVDRCTDCQALFFDEFEKEQLRKMKGAGRPRHRRREDRP